MDRKKSELSKPSRRTLLSPKDVSDILRVNYYTVRDLRQAGRIPPPDVLIGNRPRWKYDTIRDLIKAGKI